MRGFFKSYKFKVILCMIAFCAGIMIYGFTQKDFASAIETGANTLFNPIRKISYNISSTVDSTFSRFTDGAPYDENKKLKEELAAYQKLSADYDSLKEDYEELKAFMGIKEEHSDFVLSDPCTVIGYVTNDPYKSFYINKGKADGITPYCPVMTSEGIVGIVTKVSDDYSLVTTLLSEKISVSAVISGRNEAGVITGSAETAKKGTTRMLHLKRDNSKVKSGDVVVTAQGSGIFPKGCLIGTVKSTASSDSNLSDYAVITPSADPTELTTVMCILDFEGKDKVAALPDDVSENAGSEADTGADMGADTGAETAAAAGESETGEEIKNED